jgi:hypothetical protein
MYHHLNNSIYYFLYVSTPSSSAIAYKETPASTPWSTLT